MHFVDERTDSIAIAGVSVITCTNRREYLSNLIRNFTRQAHRIKELIIVVNDDKIPLGPYRRVAGKLRYVSIYRVPGQASLGKCLNEAVAKAKYPYIAKFDDDDYYAPRYLTDSLLALRRSKADVVGKRSHYMYLQGSRKLILRFPGAENKLAMRLPGATLVFKRKVFERVRFPDRSVGEDDLFCLRSKRKGYVVFSGGRRHFLALRRRNSSRHTWRISDKELLAHHPTIPSVKDPRRYVQTPPGNRRR